MEATSENRSKLLQTFRLQAQPDLFDRALTHSSFSNAANNECLETLGDAALSLAVTAHTFDTFTSEKELTNYRSQLVKNERLHSLARDLKLQDVLRVGNGQEIVSGKMLADAFEALLGACFRVNGLDAVHEVLREIRFFDNVPQKIDFKSKLKETCERFSPQWSLKYDETTSTAPFTSTAVCTAPDGIIVEGTGSGNTKKAAEQAAAEMVLRAIGALDSRKRQRSPVANAAA